MQVLDKVHVLLLLGLASAPALPAQADAREVIRRAVTADARNCRGRGFQPDSAVFFRVNISPG